MTINDQMYCLVTEAQVSRNRGLAFSSAVSGSNAANNFSGEFFGVSSFNNRVADVLLMCNPLQIVGGIIGLIKVLMVNIREIAGIWHKGLCNESRGKDGSLFPVLAKNKVPISLFIWDALNKLAAPQHGSASCFVGNSAVNTSDATKVRNLIETFVSEDWKPLFIDHFCSPCRYQYSAWRPMAGGI